MKQIIIPTESHPGEFAKITQAMADAGIDIVSIDAHEQSGPGFIVLVVEEYDLALESLRNAGYQPISEDALVIQVDDAPGALAKVAARFQAANLNLRSLHIIRRCGSVVHVSLVCDDNNRAAELVKDIMVG